MKPGLVLLPIVLLLAVTEAVLAGNHRLRKAFTFYETLMPGDVRVSQHVQQPQYQQLPVIPAIDVEFSALGRKFTLELYQSTHLFAKDFVAVTVDGEGKEEPFHVDQNEFFGGTIKGERGSVAAAHVPKSGMLTIAIKTHGGVTYHVEPSSNLIPGPHQVHMVAYHGSDVKDKSSHSHQCGNHESSHASNPQEQQAQVQVSTGDLCRIIIVADHLFYKAKQYSRTSVAQYVITIANQANTHSLNPMVLRYGYRTVTNLGVQVAKVRIYTSASPTGHYNSDDHMTIDTYVSRVISLDWSSYGLAAVVTYRHFYNKKKNFTTDGATADYSTVCKATKNILVTSFGFPKVGVHPTLLNKMVFAHEVGHTWGAHHDQDDPKCDHGIMSYDYKNLWFSWCSTRDIAPVLGAATCFVSGPDYGCSTVGCGPGYQLGKCYCSSDCTKWNDCCSDYYDVCPI